VIEPASGRFEEALNATTISAEKALGLVSHFDPKKQPNLTDTIGTLANTVRLIRDEMRRKATPADDL
jgi:hypothetical protein